MSIQTSIRKPLVAAVLGALVAAIPLSTLLARQAPVRDVAPASSVATALAAPVAADALPAAVAAPLPRTGVQLPDFSALVERYGPAVVNIQVKSTVKTAAGLQLPPGMSQDDPFFRFFQGDPRQQRDTPTRGEGSGFIVDANGIVLTNAHVVQDAKEVTVKLTDKREFVAKVLGSDEKSDVAVLKIDARNLPTVRLGDPSKVKVGEWVVAIGAPFGFENSVTQGIVSAKGRVLPDGSYVPFLQTDVAINPANSGGPLFNLDGEVIGINSQIYSRSGGYQGLSFAIPIEVAQRVAQQILATGKVRHARLGVSVQEVNQTLAEAFKLDKPAGALVAEVVKGGAAEHAGLQSGDVVLAVNGHPVMMSGDLPAMVGLAQPGEVIELQVWRLGARKTLQARLDDSEQRAVQAAGAAAAAAPRSPEPSGRLGLALRALLADEKRATGLTSGLVVEGVSGAAARAGVKAGDLLLAIDGRPVNSAEQANAAVAPSDTAAALLVQRGASKLYVALRLE